jgi:hypothetical protein
LVEATETFGPLGVEASGVVRAGSVGRNAGVDGDTGTGAGGGAPRLVTMAPLDRSAPSPEGGLADRKVRVENRDLRSQHPFVRLIRAGLV